MRLTEKTGCLAAMLMVRPDDEIMIITDDGTIIRTPVEDIRETGRVTQGVRLMRVADDSRIVDVDIAAHEDDDSELDISYLEDDEEDADDIVSLDYPGKEDGSLDDEEVNHDGADGDSDI